MYKVVWLPSLTNKVAASLVVAFEHNGGKALNRVVERLVKLLKSNPMELGESREDGKRIAFEGNVHLVYEVAEDDHIVIVVEFHYRTPN